MQYKTTAECLANRCIDQAIEDEMFCASFCEGCPEGYGPMDYECPAAWCPNDNHCSRYSTYVKFCEDIRQAFNNALCW